MLTVEMKDGTSVCTPLDEVRISGEGQGTLSVRDGMGREYLRRRFRAAARVPVGGALGWHVAELEDDDGNVVETARFRVDCRTEIDDQGGRFHKLLTVLHHTMARTQLHAATYNDRIYKFFVGWLRDHVHSLKGMKYFEGDLKTGIELYRDSQREDGMIFDLYRGRTSRTLTHREYIFGYGGFIKPTDNCTKEFQRIPVENDVEYLYIEGIYYTWKATGDDGWMEGLLDSAIAAFDYSTSDPYRWSKKYRLLKRGFTIDTWDFQPTEDEAISGHTMVVDKDKSRFGVMFGDNTGFAVGCRYLSEMLEHAGRSKEAKKYARLGDRIKERLDELSWNGEFYTHHVPEDPDVERDLGVDQSKQVSLSNAYSLNRGLTHEQCVAVINTYRRIREEMPDTSPGEWYAIYPPFPEGFRRHDDVWEYMNGGVTPIVAGELAHGAFEHGYEDYATDILERVLELAGKDNNYLHCSYKGRIPDPPERNFHTLDLRHAANVDLTGNDAPGVPMDEWNLDYNCDVAVDLTGVPTGRHEFSGIPFRIREPETDSGKVMLGLSDRAGYADQIAIPVDAKAESIYFLHALSGVPEGELTGTVVVEYSDGETATAHAYRGRQVESWWFPESLPKASRSQKATARVVWEGSNETCGRLGLTAWGWDNPHPDKKIAHLNLRAAHNGGYWYVLGISLCDAEVYFRPGISSFGIPDCWGAAAVMYALMEGLAGIKDTGVAFDNALVAPRWPAAGVPRATACAKYPASGGYVRYRYREKDGAIDLHVTGSAETLGVEVLLPEGADVEEVTVDDESVPFETRAVEASRYAVFSVSGVGVRRARVDLA